MRAALLLMAVATFAVSFDSLVTAPSEGQNAADVGRTDERLAQTGSLATPAVNPRLGTVPPGGHLGGPPSGGRIGDRDVPPADQSGTGAGVPAADRPVASPPWAMGASRRSTMGASARRR